MTVSPKLRWPIPTERSNPWFNAFTNLIRSMDSSVYALRENDCIVIGGGGTVSFNAGTNVLSWTAPIKLNAAISGFFWSVAASSLTVVDGAYIYVTLSRSPSANQVVVFETSARIPNTDPVLFVAQRQGSRIYWRNGSILQDGDSLELFLTGPVLASTAIEPVWGIEDVTPVVEYKLNGSLDATGGVLPSLTHTGTPQWSVHRNTFGAQFYNNGYLTATHPSFVIPGDMTLATVVSHISLISFDYWYVGINGNTFSEDPAENCLGALLYLPASLGTGPAYYAETGSGVNLLMQTDSYIIPAEPVLVAFTRTGTSVTLYLNDIPVKTDTLTPPTDGTNASLYIAQSPGATGQLYGSVFGVWLYDVALTQSQLRNLWKRRLPFDSDG